MSADHTFSTPKVVEVAAGSTEARQLVDAAELRALAHSLDCITEEEVQVLGDATPGTVEAWRKRGKGPSYIRFGNRFLYPRKGLAEHLETLVRERNVTPKGCL